jgi:serine/threonine-protein kinase RsbW
MTPAASNAAHGRSVLHTHRQAAEAVETGLLKSLAARGYSDASRFAVRLAVEEALTNALRHGNKDDAAKAVTLTWRVESDAVEIEIEDEGEGFDPGAVPDPTQEENIEIPSGRGLILMRAYMSEVQFDPPGNRVRMTYRRPPPR